MKKILSLLTPFLTPLVIMAFIFFAGVFAVNYIQGIFDKKIEDQKTAFISQMTNMERGFNNNINVLQRKLDETSETVEASVRSIPEPSFFQRMFNSELNKTRNEILNSIPDLIKNEIKELDLNVESTGTISMQVEGDTLTFPADQRFLEGYWGSIELVTNDSTGTKEFRLIIRPVDIDLTEVRTVEDPIIKQPRVFLTAIDRRTGREIKITSTNFSYIQEKNTGFRFDPKFSATIGHVFGLSGTINPFIEGNLRWLYYTSSQREFSFLGVRTAVFADGKEIHHFTTLGFIEVSF